MCEAGVSETVTPWPTPAQAPEHLARGCRPLACSVLLGVSYRSPTAVLLPPCSVLLPHVCLRRQPVRSAGASSLGRVRELSRDRWPPRPCNARGLWLTGSAADPLPAASPASPAPSIQPPQRPFHRLCVQLHHQGPRAGAPPLPRGVHPPHALGTRLGSRASRPRGPAGGDGAGCGGRAEDCNVAAAQGGPLLPVSVSTLNPKRFLMCPCPDGWLSLLVTPHPPAPFTLQAGAE